MEVWECDVNRELKQNEGMKHYFDHYYVVDPLNPRHALYGGQTNAAKLYHCCQGDEQIRYVDFTSLYPHVNRSKTVPTGYPEIIIENFDQDISNYFGLIKCTVLPPRGLFHPMLPHHGQNKLMFALCKMCADTGNQTPSTHSDAERHVRHVAQRIYRHVCQNQTGSQLVSQRLCHGRTKAVVRQRYF